VAPAGNDGNDNDAFAGNSFPASLEYDNVLSVGATDGNDNATSFTLRYSTKGARAGATVGAPRASRLAGG